MLEHIKLKRLNFIEILSLSKEIYFKNIKTIIFVSFFIFIPLFLFDQWLLSKSMGNIDILYQNIDMMSELDAMTSASLYNMVSSLLNIVVQPLASIAIIWGAVDIIKEQKNSVKENFLYSFAKAPSAIWTTFLQVALLFIIICPFLFVLVFCISSQSLLLLIFMSTLFLVLMLYFNTIWCFTDYVVAIQNLSGIKALIASKATVQYRFLETFLYTMIFGVLSAALNFGVMKVLNSIDSYSIYMLCCIIWDFFHHIIINGFYIVVMTVLFLNRIWGPLEVKIFYSPNYISHEQEQQNNIALPKEEPEQNSVVLTKEEPEQNNVVLPKEKPEQNSVVLTKEEPEQNSIVLTKEKPEQNSVVLPKEEPEQNNIVLTKEEPEQNNIVLPKEEPKQNSIVLPKEEPGQNNINLKKMPELERKDNDNIVKITVSEQQKEESEQNK